MSRPSITDGEPVLAVGFAHFALDGKVSWRTPERSGRAAVSWVQAGERARLVFSGALGMGSAVVTVNAMEVRLNVGSKEWRATDADELLEAQLGLPLPVREAGYWALGTLAPGSGQVLARDPSGRPLRLEQAGWEVAFERYCVVDSCELPCRIKMTHGDLRLLFIITRWRSLRADFPVEG